MDIPAFTEMSLGTIVCLGLGLLVVFLLVRWLLRSLLTIASLLASGWIAFRIWQVSPEITLHWMSKPNDLVSVALPILAFFLCTFLIRKILSLVLSPFSWGENENGGLSLGGFFLKMIAVVVISSVIFLSYATWVHHTAAIGELRGEKLPKWLENTQAMISQFIPSSFMDWLNPIASQARIDLAKLIAKSSETHSLSSDEILDSQILQDLVKAGDFSTLLRHPILTEALKDPNILEKLGLKKPKD